MSQDSFSSGVTCMARNCLPALTLVRRGVWTLDDVEKWLHAVVFNDPAYLKAVATAAGAKVHNVEANEVRLGAVVVLELTDLKFLPTPKTSDSQ